MPAGPRPARRVELTIKYSQELAENTSPPPGKPEIVLSPQEHIKARKWHITRAFYFLTTISAICLTAVIAAPKPAVQAIAAATLAAAASLARILLTAATRPPRKTRKPSK